MNKRILLKEYIKKSVKNALKEQEEKAKNAEKAIFLIHRFPKLKELFEDLMSPAFGRFVANIQIIAPKPTVFNVELINGQEFDITYLGNNKFRLRVLGKKYYPAELGDLERASQSIADLLLLSKPNPQAEVEQQKQFDNGLANDLGKGPTGDFSGGNFPGSTNEPDLEGDESLPPSNNEPLGADSEIPSNEPEEKNIPKI